jgi:hypothetical protein
MRPYDALTEEDDRICLCAVGIFTALGFWYFINVLNGAF